MMELVYEITILKNNRDFLFPFMVFPLKKKNFVNRLEI